MSVSTVNSESKRSYRRMGAPKTLTIVTVMVMTMTASQSVSAGVIAGEPERVTLTSSGSESEGARISAFSADGSKALILAEQGLDSNPAPGYFVRDLATGSVTRVFTDAAGNPQDVVLVKAAIDLRRFVVQTDLPGDSTEFFNYYLRDLTAGTYTKLDLGIDLPRVNPSIGGCCPRPYVWASADLGVVHSSYLSDCCGGVVYRTVLASGISTKGEVGTLPIGGTDYSSPLLAFHLSDSGRYGAHSVVRTTIGSDTVDDIRRHDFESGRSVLVSVGLGGAQANATSSVMGISGDGNRVFFRSAASNLVAADTPGTEDLFVRDIAAGTTSRIPLPVTAGVPLTEQVGVNGIDLGGNRILLGLRQPLRPVTADWYTYVYEVSSGNLVLVSRSLSGGFPELSAGAAAISSDGSVVAFNSEAGDVVAGDSNRTGPFTGLDGFVVRLTTVRFDDIAASVFAFDIDWLAQQGITKGCNPAGTLFCPTFPVTRAQMAAFLNRALDLAPAPVAADLFTDDNGSMFEADIEAIAQAGITLGCDPTGTRFCPDDLITRAQMAAFLNRALDLAAAPFGSDRFRDDNGSVFEADIEAIAQAGITLGCDPTGTRFCPDENITRGQMAAFLHRALGD